MGTMATTDQIPVGHAKVARWPRNVARVAGVVMLAGAGLNLVLTTAVPESYASLGEWLNGPEPLHRLWSATMGEHPRVWVPIVGIAFEAGVGTLALSRSRTRRLAGLVGIGVFHVSLLVMGLWAWAVPVLAVVIPAAIATARTSD